MRAGSFLLKKLIVLLWAIPAASGQSTLSQLTFGGSGTDSIHGITTDAAGNLYVVGTTYSADIPTLNAYQPVNSGTQIVYSPDDGVTWKPLQSPLAPGPGSFPTLKIATDPANAAIVYTASGPALCKSQDSGKSFQCSNPAFLFLAGSVNQLLVDLHTPSKVYMSANATGGVFVSADGGQTWTAASQGLVQTGLPFIITADPFHPGVLFAWNGQTGFISRDGAASWLPAGLPYPAGVSTGESFFGFFFDAANPEVVYGPGFTGSPGSGGNITIQKSSDAGRSWTQLSLPFSITSYVGADPKSGNTLYALGRKTGSGEPASFWKSSDGGATWTSTPVPAGFFGPLVFDPRNPQVILAASYGPNPAVSPATYRSADGGVTWSPVAQRVLVPAFAPSAAGVVYAAGPPTSDAFVAKFLPDGQTLVFATYFGGGGNESGNVIALDPNGNIWIAGDTSSTDLPISSGAFQAALKGQTNGFLAKFTSDGQFLASTYLGGSAADTISSLATAPDGNVWAGGRWTSSDFPFTTTALLSSSPLGYVAKLDASAKSVLVSMPLDGWLDLNGNGIATDSSGNVIVAGSTSDPNFQTTVQPLSSSVSTAPPASRAFVLKLDHNGATVYSAAFSGSKPAPVTGKGIGIPSGGTLENHGIAAAVDLAGNAYIAGYTSATDFPVTPGAFQTTLADACPYPAFENNTGLIGVIASFFMDDNFVVKLSSDGKTALYSTLIGGQCFDHAVGLAIDASGRAFVTGETDSFDYPQEFPLAEAPPRSQYASFVSVLNPSGSGLDFSSYLYAGSAPAVAVAQGGNFGIAGSTGQNAQTSPFSGAYVLPPTGPLSHGYLTILGLPQTAPALNLTQVLNGFSQQPGPVAPGEIVTLTLPGFAPDQPIEVGIAPREPLNTILGGVTVLFDGIPAYLMTAVTGKIVCIVPQEIAGQLTTAIQVTSGAGVSNILTAKVTPAAVGLLSLDGSGSGLANARNADGTLNGPSNPAAVGSVATIFFTGGGVTNPPEADGLLPSTMGSIPVAPIPIFPAGGTIYSLPDFVPGIFGYDFTVPANSGSVLLVSTQTNYYQSQFLQIYVH